jgi:low temperature requirement protein LtrA
LSGGRARSIVSPDDQGVTPVELFFDLVFVFSAAQIVVVLHDRLTWPGVGHSVLIFWLVWWVWNRYTWALNAADTTHPGIRLATLVATSLAFVMAVTVPGAYVGDVLWFAAAYTVLRLFGVVLHVRVGTALDPTFDRVLATHVILSVVSLAGILVGAAIGGSVLYGLWGLAIFLDLAGTLPRTGDGRWPLHRKHFVERYGRFVMFAIGESLLAAAATLAGVGPSAALMGAGALAVAMSCALWWSHFGNAKPLLDTRFGEQTGGRRRALARDAYTLLHFPLVLGVISIAAAVEETLLRPTIPLGEAYRVALGSGVILFVWIMGLALWRATGRPPVARFVLGVVTGATVILVAGVSPLITLGLAFTGIALLSVMEQRSMTLERNTLEQAHVG